MAKMEKGVIYGARFQGELYPVEEFVECITGTSKNTWRPEEDDVLGFLEALGCTIEILDKRPTDWPPQPN